MEINFIKHNEIDFNKWDSLMAKSPQSKIYAYSWYLNCMAPGWDALVGGDYEEVFPLPWNKKLFGFKKVFQPLLSQQLGLFTSGDVISQDKLNTYLESIPVQFKIIDINLNDACPEPNPNKWKIKKRINIELDLKLSYNEIHDKYSSSKIKNLKKNSRFDLHIVKDFSIDEMLELHYMYLKNKVLNYRNKKRKYFKELVYKAIELGYGKIWAVKDNNGNTHTVKFLLFSSNRIYNLMDISTEYGRDSASNNYLLDEIIKEFADTDYILDFEGSMIPGIAFFFKGYGGIEKPYFHITKNNLPGSLKLLLGVWNSIYNRI